MSENNNNTNKQTYLNVIALLKKNRKFVISLTFGLLILIVIYSLIMPQTYESKTKLLPPQNENRTGGLSSFLQNMSSGGIVLGNIGQSNQVTVFAEILRSRTVGEYIADKMNFKEMENFEKLSKAETAYIIQNMLKVEIERSGLISVTSSYKTSYFPNEREKDSAAVLSAQLANYAVDGLDYFLREKNLTNARKTKEFISRKMVKYNEQLDSVEAELEKFRAENKVLALDEQTLAIINQAAAVGAELNKALIELTVAKQEFSDNSPQVRAYQRTVDLLEKQYEKIQTGGLIKEDQFSIPLGKAPELIRKYEDLMRRQKILGKVILYLETQKHQEEIQEERDLPAVNVLDEAIVPTSKASPSRKFMILLGLIISGIISISIVIGRAYLKGEMLVNKEN